MTSRIAVVYLARGQGSRVEERFEKFLNSYDEFSAGEDHDLFVVMKGFLQEQTRKTWAEKFRNRGASVIDVSDDYFDIGAYIEAVRLIPHSRICFFNTNSIIRGQLWLRKLDVNLSCRGVGIVGASGSYESLAMLGSHFPVFPNVHLRSNAFLIRREHFVDFTANKKPGNKREAWLMESGISSFTRYFFSIGLDARIVGRNGRGYSPTWWPSSGTFRQRDQDNLLVHDNVTLLYEAMDFEERSAVSRDAWGLYLNNGLLLP